MKKAGRIAQLMMPAALFALAAAPLQAQWGGRSTPEHAWRRGTFADVELEESSGVAVSRAYPGILWTVNDSGNGPWIFATDTLGRAVARIPLDARNRDWEAIALGPCPLGSCLYVGDTGDNAEGREEVGIYRLAEPDPADSSLRRVQHLRIRYPDGAHDAEALVVDRKGDVWLITKGRKDGVRVYRVPAAAWRRDNVVMAEFVQILPIPADEGLPNQVTDAAMAPDGERLVVRTYGTLYFLTLAGDRFLPDRARPRCVVWGMEMQGEGVDWLGDGRLVLTSESGFLGGGGTIYVVECPNSTASSQ